jgi:hypothetical protein
MWEKTLPDGQHIRVSEPPQPDAVAVIKPTSITNASDKKPDDSGENLLKGIVFRLTLEKASAEIVATILIANLPFTLKIPQQKIQKENLYPGQQVTLHYSPDSVTWL